MFRSYWRSSSLVRFASIAFAGLTIDFSIFWILTNLDLGPGLANFTSTGFAVASTYFLSSRLVFDSPIDRNSAVLYVAWYAVSNSAFSLAIETLSALTQIHAMCIKIGILPASFLINFAASRKILNPRASK